MNYRQFVAIVVFSSVMIKRAISASILVAALSGGVMAGASLHSGVQECAMTCCRAMFASEHKASRFAAQLCCTLSCRQSATTGGSNTTLLQLSSIGPVANHPAAGQPPVAVLNSLLRFGSKVQFSQDSHPTYLRHLALLI